MNNKPISSFAVGEDIQKFFLLRAYNLKTSSNNKKYLDLELADSTGEINAKLWDMNEDQVDAYKPGDIVKIRGTVTLWQSTLQLKIVKMRPVLDEDYENGELEIDSIIPTAPIKAEVMMKELDAYVFAMKNEEIQKVVLAIIDMRREKLMTYPAAKKNHHAIRSGLLYHIIRMLRTGERLCDVYPNLNRDLVYAGIILHDMEKINEMSADELGIVSDYTAEGQLLGHLMMGIKLIDQVAKSLNVNPEISLVLQHMILTHHYEPEFGSPKKPMIPEAEMLHYIDMIDARMYDMEKALAGVEPGTTTDPIFAMDRRRLYKTCFEHSQSNS